MTYDFQVGDKLTVRGMPKYGMNSNKRTVSGKVVGVYRSHISLHTGKYVESVNLADVHCGSIKVFKVIAGNKGECLVEGVGKNFNQRKSYVSILEI